MAASKVKKKGQEERPKILSRNEYNDKDGYTFSDTISPNGRETNQAGETGTAKDIAARKNNLTKNLFGPKNPYRVDD